MPRWNIFERGCSHVVAIVHSITKMAAEAAAEEYYGRPMDVDLDRDYYRRLKVGGLNAEMEPI